MEHFSISEGFEAFNGGNNLSKRMSTNFPDLIFFSMNEITLCMMFGITFRLAFWEFLLLLDEWGLLGRNYSSSSRRPSPFWASTSSWHLSSCSIFTSASVPLHFKSIIPFYRLRIWRVCGGKGLILSYADPLSHFFWNLSTRIVLTWHQYKKHGGL